MNSETSNSEDTGPDQAAGITKKLEAPENKKKSTGSLWFTLIVALLAIGVGVHNYRSINSLRTDTGVTDSVALYADRIDDVKDSVDAISSKQQAIETSISRLEEAEASNAGKLRSLLEVEGRDNTGWAAAEIEHLLIMAIHSVTLERDVNTALAALQAADARLADIADLKLEDTRRQLAVDMDALKAVNVVDITGLSLYLADLLGRVEELPLREVPLMADAPSSEPDATDTRPVWRRLLSAIWQEVRGMFVVTRIGGNSKATLLPDESYFLYQNLRLQLETARLAVIRRDTEGLRTSMEIIDSWLIDHFDTADSAVVNVSQTIGKMAQLELDPDLPDISSSLETLHAYIKDRTATENPDPATVTP